MAGERAEKTESFKQEAVFSDNIGNLLTAYRVFPGDKPPGF